MTTEHIQLTPAQSAFLSKHIAGFDPLYWESTCAGKAGSDRRFIRIRSLISASSYVLIVWDSSDHDWPRFLTMQRDLSRIVSFLPAIFASDDSHGLILEEDLGGITLKKYCMENAMTKENIENAYHQAIHALVVWQGIDKNVNVSIASRSMDFDMFLWESDYFAAHCVSDYCGLESLLTKGWLAEKRHIAETAAAFPKVCIHRDFQSENIMLLNDKIRFVDYQGARLGPAGYDLASLIYDPYIPLLSIDMSERLFAYYQSVSPVMVSQQAFRVCAMQRLMQALGAFGNLSIHKGKEWYREYIPVALGRLLDVIGLGSDYPVTKNIVTKCLCSVTNKNQ